MRSVILKLKTLLVIGVFISLSACSSHALHSNVGDLETATYPVIQF